MTLFPGVLIVLFIILFFWTKKIKATPHDDGLPMSEY